MLQPIADRVARNLEIMFETLNETNSDNGIYDYSQLINGANDKSLLMINIMRILVRRVLN